MFNELKMPKAQVVYGDIVYSLTIVAALLCMVGPLMAVMNIDNNVCNPHYLFSAIWEGKDAMQVWAAGGTEFPGGHFWMNNITKGDGLTQFGLVLGGSVALPALLGAAVFHLKDKMYLWVGMSLWVSFLIAVSATGVVSLGH